MTPTPASGGFPMARLPPLPSMRSPPRYTLPQVFRRLETSCGFDSALPGPSHRYHQTVFQYGQTTNRGIGGETCVQSWVDALINPHGDVGISAKTVNRKLSELRNYWRYLQSHEMVPEERLPFDHRRVKDPPHDERRRRNAGSDINPRTSCGYGTRPSNAATSFCRMPSGSPPIAAPGWRGRAN